jgi:hypothetical protein
MTDRIEYATAKERDVEVLRASFDRGAAWTKEQAAVTLEIPERRFRAAVAVLRAAGYPVVSWSEEGSVYRKALDIRELDRFIDSELLPRVRKLEREARAMRTQGRTYFVVKQQQLI